MVNSYAAVWWVLCLCLLVAWCLPLQSSQFTISGILLVFLRCSLSDQGYFILLTWVAPSLLVLARVEACTCHPNEQKDDENEEEMVLWALLKQKTSFGNTNQQTFL
jgi:hypothetical protein